jgi:hypothetical protein
MAPKPTPKELGYTMPGKAEFSRRRVLITEFAAVAFRENYA